MKESDELTSAKFQFIIHGRLEVELDAVNVALAWTGASSNGTCSSTRDRTTGSTCVR
jgi:hypothetical protein